MIPLISLEEHYISSAMGPGPMLAASFPVMRPGLEPRLRDLGSQRLTDMDEGNVSVQVISHAPITGNPAQCRAANDELAAAVKLHPSRFAAFAALPMPAPTEAAAELDRCVRELRFLGALLENHADGAFYDEERFLPVFEKAQELDCVIYIHPSYPSESRASFYKGNYDSHADITLGAFGWGWHADTGLHILRLFSAGLFDRFPRLKIVIGHMGEMLPFQLERIIAIAEFGGFGQHKRNFKEVWDNNLWITTSGMFSLSPFSCMLRNTKMERILYSVDYPFAGNDRGLEFIEEIKASGLVTEEELEHIAYKNAERLLKISATTR